MAICGSKDHSSSHSAHHDLTAMRWIHPVIVDTWQLESARADIYRGEMEDIPPITPLGDGRERPLSLSLKSLSLFRLGREISPIRMATIVRKTLELRGI